LGSLVLWGVHGLVDSPYWKNDMSIEFWILAALELIAIRAISQRTSNPSADVLPPGSRPANNLI
jgi:hypothetical protein